MKLLAAATLAACLTLTGCSEPNEGTIEGPAPAPSAQPDDYVPGPEDIVADVPEDPDGILTVLTRPNPEAEWVMQDVDCEQDTAFCQAAISGEALMPVGEDVACTKQYGGPEEAIVAGEVAKEPVELYFYRTDGCEIARWEALSALTADLTDPIVLPSNKE